MAAAEIQTIDILRQPLVCERRKRHKLCPQLAQHIEVILIIEAECAVLRYRDPHRKIGHTSERHVRIGQRFRRLC